MPGTPATSPNLGIPRYAGGDPAQFAPQVNAITDRIDTVLSPAVLTGATPSFPSSPFEGQLADYVSGGLVWRFRYTTSSPTYKWVCISGNWIEDLASSIFTVPNAGSVQFDPQLAITVPFAGLYEAQAVLRVISVYDPAEVPPTSGNGVAILPSTETSVSSTRLFNLPMDPRAVRNGGSGGLIWSTEGTDISIGTRECPPVPAAGGILKVAYLKYGLLNELYRYAGSILRVRPVAVN